MRLHLSQVSGTSVSALQKQPTQEGMCPSILLALVSQAQQKPTQEEDWVTTEMPEAFNISFSLHIQTPQYLSCLSTGLTRLKRKSGLLQGPLFQLQMEHIETSQQSMKLRFSSYRPFRLNGKQINPVFYILWEKVTPNSDCLWTHWQMGCTTIVHMDSNCKVSERCHQAASEFCTTPSPWGKLSDPTVDPSDRYTPVVISTFTSHLWKRKKAWYW